MSRGPTAPVEQQDAERIWRTLEAILKEIRALRADLKRPEPTPPQEEQG